MIEISLGQRLHELRDKADLSLRELSKKVGISGPFLSDIELGRRFPSEEILAKLASALNVSLEELKQYDNREPIADLKRLMDSNPKLGFAFRTAVEKVKSGELTAEDIIAKLAKCLYPHAFLIDRYPVPRHRCHLFDQGTRPGRTRPSSQIPTLFRDLENWLCRRQDKHQVAS